MVRVPVYQQTESLRPANRSDIGVRATPEAFGAGIGRGMQRLGAGVEQAAVVIDQVQALDDELEAKERENALADWARQRMYGEGGFMTLQGKAAVEGQAAFEKEFEEKRRELGADLRPRAANMYTRASEARRQSVLQTAVVHAGQERKRWYLEAGQSRVQSFADDALVNYQSPNLINKNIAAGQLELRNMGQMLGWDEDTLRQKEAVFISSVHKGVALRLAQDDALLADEYMKNNMDKLTGEDQFELKAKLGDQILTERVQQNVDKFMFGGRRFAPDDTGGAQVQSGQRLRAAGSKAVRDFLLSKTPGKTPEAVDELDAVFATNLAALIQDAPDEIREGLGISSGYRSIETQRQLWEASDKSGRTVAAPGRSFHNHGQAVDLMYKGQRLDKAPESVRRWVRENAPKYGLHLPMDYEPWHIEPESTRSARLQSRSNTVTARASAPSWAEIQGFVAGITDPRERSMTLQMITSQMALASKAEEETRKASAEKLYQMIDDGTPVSEIPNDVIFAAGLRRADLLGYQQRLASGQDNVSDENFLYSMRLMAAQNPSDFAGIDLSDPYYASKLSKSDRRGLIDLQTRIISNGGKPTETTMTLQQAFDYSNKQLAALGITTVGKKGKAAEKARTQIAQFQNALVLQIDEFEKRNGKRPTPVEVQEMVAGLLAPVVFREEGWLWGSEREGYAFEVPNRDEGETVELNVTYQSIPLSIRRQIEVDLERQGGVPTQAQVVEVYKQFLLSSGGN